MMGAHFTPDERQQLIAYLRRRPVMMAVLQECAKLAKQRVFPRFLFLSPGGFELIVAEMEPTCMDGPPQVLRDIWPELLVIPSDALEDDEILLMKDSETVKQVADCLIEQGGAAAPPDGMGQDA